MFPYTAAEITVIVPVKKKSSRCPNKNFRPFHGSKTLLDIKIEQLRNAGVPAKAILIATDNANTHTPYRTLSDSGHNGTFAEALDYWTSRVETPELAIVHVTCPLFDDFAAFFRSWKTRLPRFDSQFVAQALNEFVLDDDLRPVNFQFGPWHGSGSQARRPLYAMTCAAFAIDTKEALHCRYYIGRRPRVFLDLGHHVDIDTEDDFRLAQLLYQEAHECPA